MPSWTSLAKPLRDHKLSAIVLGCCSALFLISAVIHLLTGEPRRAVLDVAFAALGLVVMRKSIGRLRAQRRGEPPRIASEKAVRRFMVGTPVFGVVMAGLSIWAGISSHTAGRYLFFVLAVVFLSLVPFWLWLRAKTNTPEAQERIRRFREEQERGAG